MINTHGHTAYTKITTSLVVRKIYIKNCFYMSVCINEKDKSSPVLVRKIYTRLTYKFTYKFI